LSPEDATVYLGEPSKQHLTGTKGPYSSHNPYIAPIVASREIFATPERNCLHMEVSLEGSGLSYQTGDHLAVWPTNADREVDRLLRILGIDDKRSTVVKISSTDPTTKIPVPTPTTYEAILRYYLEICAPVSRQSLPTLAQFAPTEQAKAEMLRIGNDKDGFQDSVARYCLNIAQVMEAVSGGSPWSTVPFSFILETFNHIVPRYYSISSSSKLYPNTPHITAVVEARSNGDGREVLYGVTTNYLLALKSRQHGEANPHPHGISYAIGGPRNKYDGIHVPAHTRHSNFKLPSDPRKPIIMVGPGTGVAPFRGFVQERAKAFDDGAEIGKMLLFFGCRKRDEDFLYRDEWEGFESKLGDKFEMVKAFSREQKHKVYVQNKMQDYGKEINKLLEEGAYFYICGDAANMARAVNSVLGEIIEQERGLKPGGGDEVVKMLRASNMYVPSFLPPLFDKSLTFSQVPRRRLVLISYPHHLDRYHQNSILKYIASLVYDTNTPVCKKNGRRRDWFLASYA
jgi:NADPH-ferrihemoprotein reductase